MKRMYPPREISILKVRKNQRKTDSLFLLSEHLMEF